MRSIKGIYRQVLVAAIISMLIFPLLGIKLHDFSFQERTQPVLQPTQLWEGAVKHEWQSFLEQHFLAHIGKFRSLLVLSYNEAKYRLFPTRPNNYYIWTPELGYYPVDTIRRLNSDVLHHDEIKQHYQRAARRLRILQEMLGHQGNTLLVVTPPPKARIYPEYAASYLIAPSETIMNQAISYGDVLEENGVHVLNVQRIFTERKASSAWRFFTTTSFHWSFWAGCTMTDEIMRKIEILTGQPFFNIDCSDIEYGRSKWSDTDIAAILNIFSTDAIIGEAPFPKIIPQQKSDKKTHKIVIIGDSFSDQIVYALVQALPEMSWSPGWLIRYDSFISRQSIGMKGRVMSQHSLQQTAALSEILTKDLLIMEVSDGNISRDNLNHMEFGATQTLLDGLLTQTDSGIIEPKNFLTAGWSVFGDKQWHTTGHLASFVIRPSTNGKPIQLMLDVENSTSNQSKPRFLEILLDGKTIGQTMLPQGRGMLNLTLPDDTKWQDSLVGEISLKDVSGQPLGLFLHGVQMVGANANKVETKVNANKALPSPKILDHIGMRTADLISNEEFEDILVEGLSGLESNDKESWRWALGPMTRIKFYVDLVSPLSDQARQRLLKFSFKNGMSIPDQTVAIRLNGKNIRRFSSEEIAASTQTDADITFTAKEGVNILEIAYQDWNHGKKHYGSNDPRKLAVVVMRLSLQVASK